MDFRNSDDAGVYQWESGPALVQTVDFFAPIVDDPYTYGQIAAANAISDIYAMGGRPLTALAIAGFPKGAIDRPAIRAIFRGGLDKLREADVALLGGHTVQDQEIKFGYAVTGSIDPARILSRAGARPGDVLFLTKPLGTGVIATALKFERISAAAAAPAIEAMLTLNRAAAEALQRLPAGAVHACTDITGFGLIGHGTEVAAASGVTLLIETSSVPVFAGALDIASRNRSGGLTTNEEYYGPGVRGAGRVHPDRLSVLYDPQTSGGLLISAARESADRVAAELKAAGVSAARIGEVRDPELSVRVDLRS